MSDCFIFPFVKPNDVKAIIVYVLMAMKQYKLLASCTFYLPGFLAKKFQIDFERTLRYATRITDLLRHEYSPLL